MYQINHTSDSIHTQNKPTNINCVRVCVCVTFKNCLNKLQGSISSSDRLGF